MHGGFDLVVVATETRYVPMRLMVLPSIRTALDLKGKKLGVGRAGLDEYAALLYLDRVGLVPGKDVQIVYMAGGIPNRATAMKQGLVDGVVVNPPNEYELEKAGYYELANFLDFKMPYAGVPQTVTRLFRDRNRRAVEDYIGAIVEGMQIFAPIATSATERSLTPPADQDGHGQIIQRQPLVSIRGNGFFFFPRP